MGTFWAQRNPIALKRKKQISKLLICFPKIGSGGRI